MKNKINVSNVDKYIILQHNQYNINNEGYIQELKEFISHVIEEEKYEILLFPIGYVHEDIKFLEKININHESVHVITEKLNTYDMLSVISSSEGYIGTSLHGLITASAYNVPIMSINTPNLVKVHGYLELIGKENVEAKTLQEMYNIYDNYFLTGYNEKIEVTREKVSVHFDTMFKHISSGRKTSNKELLEIDILSKLFVSNETKIDFKNQFIEAKVYYSETDEFDETNCKLVKWYKEEKYTLEFNIESAKMLRIDPIEGYYIKISNIDIFVDGEKVDYIIPENIMINDICYINSLDPQIIIVFDDCIRNGKLNIVMDIQKVAYGEIQSVIHSQNEQFNLEINELRQHINDLEIELNKTIRTKIKEKLRKQ
ncbi:MAG: polysaccharide pyruvyl transferase family protein [Coprobacillaceae bacterium]